MISAHELQQWLDSLPPGADVWIDDGGLTLEDGHGHYIEVGGAPSDPPTRLFHCDECGWQGPEEDTVEALDLRERLDYNGPYTDKECPNCKALAYLVPPPLQP